PRSSQRYQGRKPERDRSLVSRMEKLARKHPRYGYRRIHALLRREGWRVNRKRVQRLWREHGFKVPLRQGRRRRLGSSENGAQRRRAEYPNHVWSYDFTLDATEDGRRLKFLPVVDEFTRECHALEVERSITAEGVIATLDYLFRVHGEPAYSRTANGPELIANAIKQWPARSRVPADHRAAERPVETWAGGAAHPRRGDAAPGPARLHGWPSAGGLAGEQVAARAPAGSRRRTPSKSPAGSGSGWRSARVA